MSDDKPSGWQRGDDLEAEAAREINNAQATQPAASDVSEMAEQDAAADMFKVGPMTTAAEMKKIMAEDAARVLEQRREAARLTARDELEKRIEAWDGTGASPEFLYGGEADQISKDDLRLDDHNPARAPQVFYKGPANAVTEDECQEFLRLYASTGVWNMSAYMIGRSGKTFRDRARQDPIFAIQVGEAVQDWRESLQTEAIRRGSRGWLEPQFAGKDGNLVGYTRKFSDLLLKMELEAAWPERYRPNHKAQETLPTQQQSGVMVVPGVARSSEEWKNAVANRPPSRSLERVTRPFGSPRKEEG